MPAVSATPDALQAFNPLCKKGLQWVEPVIHSDGFHLAVAISLRRLQVAHARAA
jgi:hypothetical protein